MAKTKKMKFEVKKFQTMRTRNGRGYSYDLYIDGVRALFVVEEGNGGELNFYGIDDVAEQKFCAYIESLPPEPLPADAEEWEKKLHKDGFVKIEAEDFLERLTVQYETTKSFKRACKNKTLFRLPSDPRENYRIMKTPFSAQVKAVVLAEYPGATFINEEVAAVK